MVVLNSLQYSFYDLHVFRGTPCLPTHLEESLQVGVDHTNRYYSDDHQLIAITSHAEYSGSIRIDHASVTELFSALLIP